NNGFLTAFNAAKAGGESPLLDRLLAPDTRRLPGESGAAMVRRLFASNLQLNAVASLAASLGQRLQGGGPPPGVAPRRAAVLFLSVPAVPQRNRRARDRFQRLVALPRARSEARTALRQRRRIFRRLHAVALEGHAILRSGVYRRQHRQQSVGQQHAIRRAG